MNVLEKALLETVTRLEAELVPPLALDESVYCGFIPLNLARFIEGLTYLATAKPHACFMDVGCGIGTKLLLAQAYGFATVGIEIRPEYASIARRLCSDSLIIEADADTWTDYSTIDIVFSYQILTNTDQLFLLESKIINKVRDNTLLWLPFRATPTKFGLHEVASEIWRK